MYLPHLIRDQISIRPQAIAERTPKEELTYYELDHRASRWATILLQADVQPEQLVGVFMHRSPDTVAALLGIWKIGAAYLALDPNSPPERSAFELQDAAVSIVIAEKKLAVLLRAGTPVVRYDDTLFCGTFPTQSRDTEIALSPNNLAYVLYTSGSTGRPKGVEVCHHSLANVVVAIAEELRSEPGDVLLAHTSPSFDVSNLESFLPLSSGGTLYIAQTGRVADGVSLKQVLEQSGAKTMLGTCSLVSWPHRCPSEDKRLSH